MHFGFALELSDIDLWNTDLLDTHLGLLNPEISIQISPVSILFVSVKSLRGLQDMSSRHLQGMSSRPTNVCWGVSKLKKVPPSNKRLPSKCGAY